MTFDASAYYQPYNYNLITKLPQSIEEGDTRAREDALRQALMGGLPRGPDGEIDWNAAVQLAARTGNISSLPGLTAAQTINKQAQEEQALRQLAPLLSGMGGATPGLPTAPPAAPAAPPGPRTELAPEVPGAPSRPIVPSSARVVGDKEAVAAGLYETPGATPTTPPPPGLLPVPPGGVTEPTPQQTENAKVRLASALGAATEGGSQPLGNAYASTAPGTVPPPPAPVAAPPVAPPVSAPQQVAQAVPQPVTGPDVQAQARALLQQANPFSRQMAAAAALLPRLPPNTATQLTHMLTQLQKGYELTKDQKEWANAVLSGGLTEDFPTYLRLNRAAQAGVVTSAEGITAKQREEMIKADAETYRRLDQKHTQQLEIKPVLDMLENISDRTPQGFMGAIAPVAQKFLSAAGVPWQGGSNAELMVALSRQLVPAVRDPGSTSNLEQQMYISAVGGLTNSTVGRQLIISMMRAQIERTAQLKSVVRGNLGAPDLEAKIAALENKPLLNPIENDRFKSLTGVPLQPPLPGAFPGRDPQGRPGWYVHDANSPSGYAIVRTGP
jgi:hypothetical protein